MFNILDLGNFRKLLGKAFYMDLLGMEDPRFLVVGFPVGGTVYETVNAGGTEVWEYL